MEKAHSQVQATETESHQDIEHSDESLDGLRAILFPDYEGLYTGPGAYTAREIQSALKLNNHEHARARARKAALSGLMVEVKVLRTKDNGGEYITTGWVTTGDYNEWMSNNASNG